jgi:hypothetical protein
VCQVCLSLLVLAVVAEESPEEKKVGKRGLVGLGYGYGHSLGYVPTVLSTPALSYTKVSSLDTSRKLKPVSSYIRGTIDTYVIKITFVIYISKLYLVWWDMSHGLDSSPFK